MHNNMKLTSIYPEFEPVRVSAWLPDQRKWPKEDFPLKVFFMNGYPSKWECTNPADILAMANEVWTDCFTMGQDDSHIRVAFEGIVCFVLCCIIYLCSWLSNK